MTDKILLRRSVQLRRDAMPAEERTRRSDAATARLQTLLQSMARGPTALFMSFGHEIDTTGAIAFIRSRGDPVLLPRVLADRQGIAFHRHEPDDPLIASRVGILEPAAIAPRQEPAILIVPLLAFDSHGRRLGYGAGHYDRALAHLRAKASIVAIGFAFATQEEPELPEEPHDQRLDWLVTDEATLKCV